MKCKICLSESVLFAEGVILHKNRISYFLCEHCGFVQTEEPYWLQEAYSEAINRSDVGLVSRNIVLAAKTKALIHAFFDPEKRFLDYGGGYGLLVRMMRDFGFDFYRYDSHCENIFAKGFDVDVQNPGQFELLTAFEVFEHLVEPLLDIDRMLSQSSSILFTTELVPRELPKPGNWWYYALDHGQHVSLYSIGTLSYIAEKYRLHLYTDGRTLHFLTKKRISDELFKILTHSKVAHLVNALIKRKSLLQDDYQKSIG